jgi:uncharacterized protein YceK
VLKRMHIVALAVLMTLGLNGCSTIAPMLAKALTGASQKGIDVDANIAKGDAEGADSVAQNANTAVQVDATKEQSFGNVETVKNYTGLRTHELLLLVLLAGWAIPSPRQMLLSVRKWFRPERSDR